MSFQVDDLDSEYTRLCKSGVEFKQSPMEAGDVKMAVLDDTCGNLYSINTDVENGIIEGVLSFDANTSRANRFIVIIACSLSLIVSITAFPQNSVPSSQQTTEGMHSIFSEDDVWV